MNASTESAENIFKQILEDFFKSVYDEKNLPSHGIEHHRRVWTNAKDIITHLHRTSSLSVILPEKLIVACYLHDAGMSADPGPRHGKISREICLEFLATNHLDLNEYRDVLDAIEFHDRKDYNDISYVTDLLTILSAADDLDAFGFTGIYRYIEIYTQRRVPLYEIGYKIKDNAAGRFSYFLKNFGMIEDLISKHKSRYDILDDFFSAYNTHVTTYKFSGKKPSGYCGVVELLNRLIKSGENPLKFHFEEQLSDDPVIRWFFRGLKEEYKRNGDRD